MFVNEKLRNCCIIKILEIPNIGLQKFNKVLKEFFSNCCIAPIPFTSNFLRGTQIVNRNFFRRKYLTINTQAKCFYSMQLVDNWIRFMSPYLKFRLHIFSVLKCLQRKFKIYHKSQAGIILPRRYQLHLEAIWNKWVLIPDTTYRFS